MGKVCSHCASKGHNSRMCQTYNKSTLVSSGFKLFGVHLELDTPAAATSAMEKSSSVDCFSPSLSLSSCTLSNVTLPGNPSEFSTVYPSDSLNRHPQNRKRGVSWTDDEHKKFLAGLAKLGKGDWKGISKHFVQSRTPTQVASHAQKYFLKQHILNKKRETPSLFSMQTESREKRSLNVPWITHDHTSDISEALWQKYANRYYSEALCRKPSYLKSHLMSLLVSNWLYNSDGLSTYPMHTNYLKPTIVDAEPNLELTLAVSAPKQDESKTCGFIRT